VRANHDQLGWIDIEAAGEVDLQAPADLAAVLGLDRLPTGSYDQVRLHVVDSWVVDGGVSGPLAVPSGDTAGLKLLTDLTIEECGQPALSTDGAAQVQQSSRGWQLKPTLEAAVGFTPCSCDDPAVLGTSAANYVHAAVRRGALVYTAAYGGGMLIYDVADPTDPVVVAAMPFEGTVVHDIELVGSIALLAAAGQGVISVDVSDPTAPVEVGRYLGGAAPWGANALALDGDALFVSAGHGGLELLDVTDPVDPVHLSRLPGLTIDVQVSGSRVLRAGRENGFEVVDVSNPLGPTSIGRIADVPTWRIEPLGSRWAMIAASEGYGPALVVDLVDPTAPVVVAESPIGPEQQPAYVTAIGDRLYVGVFSANGPHHLQVLDASDPLSLSVLGTLDTPTTMRAVVPLEGGLAVLGGGYSDRDPTRLMTADLGCLAP
jgi:hypothetical protein